MTKEKSGSNFCPYIDLESEEYLGLLLCLNESYIQGVKEQLELFNIFENLTVDLAIVAVGSDGKQERHPRSRIELVLIGNQPSGELSRIAYELNEASESLGLDNQRIGGTEIKTLVDNASYYKNQKNLVYPDRVINSVLVYGNPQIHRQIKVKALEEISSPTAVGKSIRKEMKKQLHQYHKASTTGIYRNKPAFSFDKGMQYYHEGSDYLVTGFKIPFLRSVQRMADLLTIAMIKQKIMPLDEASETLPTTTVTRLELFSNLGLLPNQKQLIRAYVWFLQQYHYVQETNKLNPLQLTGLEFDREKFAEHYQVFQESIVEFFKKKS